MGLVPSELPVSPKKHWHFKNVKSVHFKMLAPILYKHSAGQTKQVCWLNLARRAARLQSLMEEAEIRSGEGRLTFSL